ncbi:MAG TPA: hypothetical protein O0X32_01860 [Methanocorpusculum sp.]|nr:hypothetical protein [Methanocorpusculum sp.]
MKEQLLMLGEVATAFIKHIWWCLIKQPESKDRTVHCEEKSPLRSGINQGKSVLTLKTTDVFSVLDIYDFLSSDYCAVLGDLDGADFMGRNLTTEDLFAQRDASFIHCRVYVRKST